MARRRIISDDDIAATAGLSFRQMADRLGVSRAGAHKARARGRPPKTSTPVVASPILAIARMTNADFAEWRARNFPTRNACATALEIDRFTVEALETGLTRKGALYPVRRYIALACAAWEALGTG